MKNNLLHMSHATSLRLAVICLLVTWYFAVAILPVGAKREQRVLLPDLYPSWYASRGILFHRQNPYTPATTRQIQIGMYGRPLSQTEFAMDQQRFSYPLFSALFFLPLAVLPFSMAQNVAWVGSWGLIGGAVYCWTAAQSKRVDVRLPLSFALASYPVVHAIQLRQPTVLITAMLCAVVLCAIKNRLIMAGVLSALSTAKPQLAIAVVVPLAAWALSRWSIRKRYLIGFLVGFAALMAASELLVPGWISSWIATLQAYRAYVGANPLLFEFISGRAGTVAATMVAVAAIMVVLKWRDTDLLFSLCFAVATMELLIPWQLYNEILLVFPMLWLADNLEKVARLQRMSTLLHAVTWLLLSSSWACMLLVLILARVNVSLAASIYLLPLVPFALLPFSVYGTISSIAIGRVLSQNRWDTTDACAARRGL